MNSNEKQYIDNIEEYFDKILDVFYDGIYISDSAGKTLKINKMYEKLTGLKREELVGRLVNDLKREGYYDVAVNPIIVKTGKPQTTIQSNKIGRKLVLNGNPVFDQNGKVAYVVTYVRDITALSQLKEQVSSQAKLIEKYCQETQYLRSINLKSNVIIESPKMVRMMELLERIAATDTTALILGETGVGKDVFAKKIHEMSPRKDEAFFKLNCATIPENLIESELFGYDPGAFSGAHSKGKPGYFEMADNGTLFLDEIGELPLAMQAKLLRILQDQEVIRLGSTKLKKVNVRIIAATNRNLSEAIKEGTFRTDLYYRLRVAVLDIPPLRERKEEIIPLLNFFLDKFNTKYKKRITLSDKSIKFMQNYKWPGNVREMENLIQGLIVTQDKELLDVNDLPNYLQSHYCVPMDQNGDRSLKEIMDELEKDLLKNAIDIHGSISKVAKLFQVDRTTIFRKLKKYDLIR